jgi:hypothetical protein
MDKGWMMAEYVTKDSGNRQEWDTGSKRDTREGKGRYDLIPTIPLRRLAGLYERGAQKYDDRNWEKGQPLMRYVDSAMRHLQAMAEGRTDEDHAAAVAWNAFAFMHTLEMIQRDVLPEELDDRPRYDGDLMADLLDEGVDPPDDSVTDALARQHIAEGIERGHSKDPNGYFPDEGKSDPRFDTCRRCGHWRRDHQNGRHCSGSPVQPCVMACSFFEPYPDERSESTVAVEAGVRRGEEQYAASLSPHIERNAAMCECGHTTIHHRDRIAGCLVPSCPNKCSYFRSADMGSHPVADCPDGVCS